MPVNSTSSPLCAARLRIVAFAGLGLPALALLTYLPFQTLPLISDDYLQIDLARQYGPPRGWGELIRDPLYRCRATSLVATYWTDRLFGLNPVAYNLSSLALHAANVWLVLALGRWPVIGWRVAAIGAAFFAIQIAPQEAVVWYSALPELLQLLFALLTVHAWLLWLERRRSWLYAASLGLLAMALLSKESAVAIVPLLGLIGLLERTGVRFLAWRLAPHAALTLAYVLAIFVSAANHGHFHDAGTFSLAAPFWRTWLISQWRLFWVWGLAAMIALGVWRPAGLRRLLAAAGGWTAVALLPYCFLTYMPFVPSRHTYFASVGESLLVGAAFAAFARRYAARRWAVAGLAGVIILHQVLYLWIRKYPQYIQRAADTEDLIAFAQNVSGPIYVRCFPLGLEAAEKALKLRLGKAMASDTSEDAGGQGGGRRAEYCHETRLASLAPPAASEKSAP